MSDDEHLTTGWEPDVVPGDTMQRAFVFAVPDARGRGYGEAVTWLTIWSRAPR